MIAAAMVIVLLVGWAAWHGARTADDILAITPSVVRPETPVPNLPRGPVVPSPPIPAPQ